MKKRRIYIGISLFFLLLFLASSLFITSGKVSVFLDKSGSLNTLAAIILCICIFSAVFDFFLFMFTKQGKLSIKQSFSEQGTMLVFLTATVLITVLVSYFSLFCVHTLENSTHNTTHESIVDIISNT